MSKESKSQKPKKTVEVLELNKETLQDLTEPETEQVKGGVRGGSDACKFPPTYTPECDR
jgi:hypothetical protein